MIKNDKIVGVKPLKEGKWLAFNEITYFDKTGKLQHWESVDRQKDTGAVAVIPLLKQSQELLFIKQFRAPAQGYVYEFPAGLIENGASAEDTALKELTEETGYTGELVTMVPPSLSSPGLSGESVYIALVEIDETLAVNITPTPALEHTEDITTERIAINDLAHFLFDSGTDVNIDAKLCCFALGLSYKQ